MLEHVCCSTSKHHRASGGMQRRWPSLGTLSSSLCAAASANNASTCAASSRLTAGGSGVWAASAARLRPMNQQLGSMPLFEVKHIHSKSVLLGIIIQVWSRGPCNRKVQLAALSLPPTHSICVTVPIAAEAVHPGGQARMRRSPPKRVSVQLPQQPPVAESRFTTVFWASTAARGNCSWYQSHGTNSSIFVPQSWVFLPIASVVYKCPPPIRHPSIRFLTC